MDAEAPILWPPDEENQIIGKDWRLKAKEEGMGRWDG